MGVTVAIMFSCGNKKTNAGEQRRDSTPLDSSGTPIPPRCTFIKKNAVPNRPPTGTPAPWTPRLSVPRTRRASSEVEALLNQLFDDFLSSGQVDRSLEKLETSGSFERDGETNVFVRLSKSIIDTLAKHWTTTRGADILSMAVVSIQLLEKQQKLHKFLHFLALSKCREELYSRQSMKLSILLKFMF